MRHVNKPLQRSADPVRTRELPLGDEHEALAQRFHAPIRREIRQFLRASPRLADLGAVFPGALYAIASRQGPAASRRRAVALVEEGAPLKHVARMLELPLWLRRLPPESFQGPVPALPLTETFARRIVARLPRSDTESAFWLASVAFAAEAAHEDFALWIAEQSIFEEHGDPARLLGVLAAYAWYSGDVFSRCHGLIVVPWRAEISFDTGLCAAKSWLNRIRLILQLPAGVLTDPWLDSGTSGNFTFTPLLDARDLLDEAHAMQNCADQYADRLARERCRLFSVRRGQTRVATLEIGPHTRENGVLAITQLKARYNMPASLDIWQAALGWLASQQGLKRLPQLGVPERPLDTGEWTRLMAPYRQRHGLAPWLPREATPHSFATLDAGMADLARRAGVTSWLFT